MKLSIVFMFCSLGSVVAVPVFSQQAKLDVSYRQQPLGQVLSDLRNRSGFDLIFFEGVVPENIPVTIVKNGVTITEILDEILPAYGLGYTINENIVTIKRAVATELQQPPTRSVTGLVTDSSGTPLVGVSVSIKGTTQGVPTGVDGRYVLPMVPADATLVFSYVGMITQEVVVGDQTTISVRMVEDAVNVKEVVVTGSFNKPKESYTGAAVKLTGTELLNASTGNLITSIANLDPTFYVAEMNELGSDPNAIPVVTMRGNTSLPMSYSNGREAADNLANQNRPLVILNGFESSFTKLMDIDEYMVESITILKDASATALYGTRGANGVVVIVTKTPEKGQLRVNYRGSVDFEIADLTSYNLMNAREKVEFEKLSGLFYDADAPVEFNNYRENLYNARKTEVERGVDTYWLKYPVHKVGIGHKHSINIDGGEETFLYGINASYDNNNGIMKGSNRNTFNGGMNFIYRVSGFTFRNDLQFSNTVSNVSPYGNFSQYTLINSYYKPYDDDGNLVRQLNNIMDYTNPNVMTAGNLSDIVDNPLWDAVQDQMNRSRNMSLTNNFSLEWKVSEAFNISSSFSLSHDRTRSDIYYSREMNAFKNYTSDEDILRRGSYDMNMGQSLTWYGQLRLEYMKTFNDVHQLYAGIGGNINQSHSENYGFRSEGLQAGEDFYGSAVQYRKDSHPSGSDNLSRSVGLQLTLNYTYDNRYFVDLSGMYDGSSVFGENNRFAPIGSVGAGWNLHREKFFNWAKVDRAQFRANYGLTGSQGFQPYMSQVLFNTFDLPYDIWTGFQIASLGNPNMQWQKTYSWNVGTEWQLFNNRLFLDFNVYSRLTKALVTSLNRPSPLGFTNYYANIGSTENKGFDVTVRGAVIDNRDQQFRWDVGLTVGHNKNLIKEISETIDRMNNSLANDAFNENKDTGYKGTDPAFMYKEGQSINTIYALPSKGIDPSTGREVFVNRYGQEIFSDKAEAADMMPSGVTDADFHGTISTTVRYKGFRLRAYFNYSYGGQAYNYALASKVENTYPYNNLDRRALYNRWREPGQQARFKGIKLYREDTKATTRFVMDNDFFKLATLNFSYEIPVEWAKRNLGASFLEVTGATSDLFHIATIKRERGTSYPFARTFQLSLTARF